MIDADGGAPRRLTRDFIEEPPSWSRDGKWVYFTSNRGDGDALWRVSAGGGLPIRVARNGWDPVESSDAKFVYYGDEDSIWKAATGGGSPILLVRKGWIPVVESSDGKFIYYRKPNGGIWKVPAAGGKAVTVLKTGKRALLTSSVAGIYVLDPDAEGGPAIDLLPFASKRREIVRLPGQPDRYVEPNRRAGRFAGWALDRVLASGQR